MQKASTELCKVISVNEDNCVNCHACIAICPVKICNDGSQSHVTINQDTCIGCGRCLSVCTHNARTAHTDINRFISAIDQKDPVFILLAPSVVANFPTTWKKLIGWLRAQGVKAVFDVSYGAEETTRSYAEYIKTNQPECLISSACPTIVHYIATYQPQLLPHLAPIDSPMIHTLKIVHELYPELQNTQAVMISPCPAKKREFNALNKDELNITIRSLKTYLEEQHIDLNTFEDSTFDPPLAGTGTIYSSPGGMVENLEKIIPGISKRTRRIEGGNVFTYLTQLPRALESGNAPQLIDCLSCAQGCNGGPESNIDHFSLDELESFISNRCQTASHQQTQTAPTPSFPRHLFARKIENFEDRAKRPRMTEEDRDRIYEQMLKKSPKDLLNCTACGYLSCEEMAQAIFNQQNRPENCHAFLQRKMSEEHDQVKELQQRFHTIFDNSHDAVLVGDINHILECNMAACDLLGYSREELLTLKMYTPFLKNQDHATRGPINAQEFLNQASDKIITEEWLLQRANLTPFHAKVRISRIKARGTQLIQMQILDLSAQKRAKQLEIESIKYIKKVIESVEAGILIIDAQTHRIIDINDYALRVMKATKEQIINHVCHDFICPAQHGSCPISDFKQQIDTQERVLLDIEKREIPILKTVVEVELAGRPCLIESFIDISTKKETEKALKNARDAAQRANRSKSEFLANMSHEIRTPMNGVLGMADLLMETNLNQEQKELSENIYKSSNNLLMVLNDILDLSKIEAGEMTLENIPFNLLKTIHETTCIFSQLAAERGNKLMINIAKDLPKTFMGDPLRLRQILVNLLGNAIKFTHDGQITLEISAQQAHDEIYLLEVIVRDTGIGISPERINGIFDKFAQADSSTTRKYGGSGLGLAITYQFIELMQGSISVTSQLGKGTCFSIELPLNKVDKKISPSKSRVPASLAEPIDMFSHLNILLAEDNRVNQIVFTKQLARLGCTITIAENGQEALEKLQAENFDLVLMDCSMPVMDGFEATRRIRNELGLKELIIIAVTAHAMEGDNQRCFEAGMNEYITKPVKKETFHQTLLRYFLPINAA